MSVTLFYCWWHSSESYCLFLLHYIAEMQQHSLVPGQHYEHLATGEMLEMILQIW